jgi:Guanylate kinase
MKGKIITITGPSGSGKTTIANFFDANFGKKLVSFTTRKPRKSEIDGEDYYFITKEQALELKKDCIEYTIYNDNYYGYLRNELDEKSKDSKNVLAVVDTNGFKAFNSEFEKEIVPIFLIPTYNKIKENLENRNDPKEDIEARLSLYDKEIESIKAISKENPNSILWEIGDEDDIDDLYITFSLLISDLIGEK